MSQQLRAFQAINKYGLQVKRNLLMLTRVGRRMAPAPDGPLAGCQQRGVALIDTLIAAPLVLWLGMSVLQWGLVFHGRYAVNYALLEAARAGSVSYAEPESIRMGLARGLVPFLYGADDFAQYTENLMRARAHIEFGETAGWIEVRQLSPTTQAFADWGVPARDDEGRVMSGQVEIPIDSLRYRMTDNEPATGAAGSRGSEPIGSASGQTLADANLLKVEMVYGMPLTVPLVGRLAIWTMRQIDGCGEAGTRRLGVLELGDRAGGAAASGTGAAAVMATAGARPWTCRFYDAVDEDGRSKPRWPIRMSAIVRMQSPARHAGNDYPTAGAAAGSAGFGLVDASRDPGGGGGSTLAGDASAGSGAAAGSGIGSASAQGFSLALGAQASGAGRADGSDSSGSLTTATAAGAIQGSFSGQASYVASLVPGGATCRGDNCPVCAAAR